MAQTYKHISYYPANAGTNENKKNEKTRVLKKFTSTQKKVAHPLDIRDQSFYKKLIIK
jgi:hypothetical protein